MSSSDGPNWPTDESDSGASGSGESSGEGSGSESGGSAAPPPPASPSPSAPPPPPARAESGQRTTSGLGKRFLGRFLDGLIVGIPMAIIVGIIPGVSVGGFLGSILTTFAGFAYFVYLEANQGATLAKNLLNMRVESSTGGNLTIDQAVRRNAWVLIGLLSGIPVIGILASLASIAIVIYIAITINSDDRNQGWHDKLADALVTE